MEENISRREALKRLGYAAAGIGLGIGGAQAQVGITYPERESRVATNFIR